MHLFFVSFITSRSVALFAANVAFLTTAVTAVVASSIAPSVASSGFATVAKSIVPAITPVCVIGTIVAGCGVFSALIAVIVIVVVVVVVVVVVGLCTLGTAAYVVANSVSQVRRDSLEGSGWLDKYGYACFNALAN
jgi:hypothetical protein